MPATNAAFKGVERQYRDTCGKCGARRVDNQIGLEPDPESYVAKLVEVFREVRRLLRDDGTLWLNLGDSYNGSGGSTTTTNFGKQYDGYSGSFTSQPRNVNGLGPKQLLGIPWAVAKALQQPYYTGRIARERDRVWLAATIDAEGSICGFTHVRKDSGDTRRGIHIAITNTNTKMLDEAYRIWKTSRQDHNFHGEGHFGSLDTYRWIAHGVEEKQQLLAELYPYLICKKTQALLAWNFLEISKQARGRNKGIEGDQNRDKSAWIVDALSKLNHFQTIDIPSWCKEPPSLYEEGYYLRSEIIWHKKAPMPESVTDRPTKSHEYVFLLAKSRDYYYDADAIREPQVLSSQEEALARASSKGTTYDKWEDKRGFRGMGGLGQNVRFNPAGRNKRSVWTLGPEPSGIQHFAVMPTKLVEPCILAGSSARGCCAKCGSPWARVTESAGERATHGVNGVADLARGRHGKTSVFNTGVVPVTQTVGWEPTCTCNADVVPCVVLDPFAGAGTTLLVANRYGRRAIGCELNPEYIKLATERLDRNQPMLAGLTL